MLSGAGKLILAGVHGLRQGIPAKGRPRHVVAGQHQQGAAVVGEGLEGRGGRDARAGRNVLAHAAVKQIVGGGHDGAVGVADLRQVVERIPGELPNGEVGVGHGHAAVARVVGVAGDVAVAVGEGNQPGDVIRP